MFTVQGKLVSHDVFTSKKGEEMQTVSIFTSINNFGKSKPKIFEFFVPVKVKGLDSLMEKTVIMPCSPLVKNGDVQLGFAEDGRKIHYHNEKGEVKTLVERPESLNVKTG
jgi:hypothetical protein